MADQKQYLIQFLATMQGDKIVVSGLKQMEKTTQRVTKTTQRATKATGRWDKSMMMVAKRALMVAPVWLLLRSAMMGVMNTVRGMIQANVELNEQMSRIKTVVSASSDSIEQDMVAIRAAILDMAATTTAPLVDLAKAFYFLRTSNLDTEEAMAAFKPTVDLAIGTMNDLASTARTVAGIYATLGKYLGDNLTLTQKFQKITDGLAYTYATQEVQMSELLQSYIKIAPYIGGMTESWTELVTILGFLNTKQLKAGRTGRLLGRTFLQIIKNSQKLASIFGITFDPNKPISFLDLLKRINDTLAVQGKRTAAQSEALRQIFATRGAVAPSLLLESFDELTTLIGEAEQNMEGFAERMSEIMQKTIKGQMQRTRNLLAVLSNEFFSAASGTGDFVDVLESLNNALEQLREPLKRTGLVIGWLTTNMAELIIKYQDLAFGPDTSYADKLMKIIVPIRQLPGLITRAKSAMGAGFKFTSFEETAQSQDKATKKAKERTEQQAKIKEINTAMGQAVTDNLKREKIEEKNIIELMKIKGATVKEIAEFRLENFHNLGMFMEEEERSTGQLERLNDKINAGFKERVQLTQNELQHHTELYKLFGADSVEVAKLNYEIQKMLFGENDVNRTLKAKLELEREILSAKRGQYQYTSDEVKIMEAYKKYGEDVARTMAKVITGEIEPKRLEKKELVAFRELFPERAKAEKVREFYKDEGRGVKRILDRQEERERRNALEKARRMGKVYGEAPTREQIKMELEKITLPAPVDVNVKAEIKVTVDEEKLIAKINKMVNGAIRSPENTEYYQKKMFEAEE